MRGFIHLFIFCSACSTIAAYADDPAKNPVSLKWGAFVDTYYAYDFNRPSGDRTAVNASSTPPAYYATQPARHDEFNVNLAYIEAVHSADRTRGRLALQAGTSVLVNYATETANESKAGPGLTRQIQEAYAGYRIAEGLWVDAGIYFSHIGLESFISRDNWTYTRSLASENTPYYQTGVRFSSQLGPRLSAQFHLLNGWQNVTETNPQKAVGIQLSYQALEALTVTYNDFVGYEAGARQLHDLVVKWSATQNLNIGTQLDAGWQKIGEAWESWYSASLIGRYQITPKFSGVGRVEKFVDSKAVIVASPTGFLNVSGASMGADIALDPRLLWRTEVRGVTSSTAVFPGYAGPAKDDVLAVTSLALTLE